MPCPACQAAVIETAELARCPSCGTVFDPLAAPHPSPKALKTASVPRGLTVQKTAAELVASLRWVDVWALPRWPAAGVTLLHFVLIGFGLVYGAWGAVALLSAAVAVQFFVYARVLAQHTRLVATATELRIERMRGAELFPRAQLVDLFVLEVAPRSLSGAVLPPKRKRTRMYGLCALAPTPRRLIDGLPSLQHAHLLEDALRVTLGLAPTEVKGAIRAR
jgi:hypothetical protein